MIPPSHLLLALNCIVAFSVLPGGHTNPVNSPFRNQQCTEQWLSPKGSPEPAPSFECYPSLNVKSNPIFDSLEDSDIERIMTKLEKIEKDEGEVFIAENDKDNDMYFISDGELECYSQKKPKNIIKKLGPGDFVGELALFLGNPRALSVRAKTKATVWRLSKNDFDAAVQDSTIADDQILRLLKRAYNTEKYWAMLPKLAFNDGQVQASWERPHPHEGKLRPYNAAEALLQDLDRQALDTLESGKLYKTTLTRGDNVNCIVAVQDVNAPTEKVLGQILDYDKYDKKVSQMLDSELYQRKSNLDAPDTETYFSRLKTGMRGFSMEFFVKATHYPAKNTVVWLLDYDKNSEIDDACGYWRAEPHPEHPDTKTRLFYSVEMNLGPNVAGCVASYINKKAASDGMTWVKKYSEE